MDQERLPAILKNILIQAVDEKTFPGCVVGFVTKEKRFVLPVGGYTYSAGSPRISEESIFDVASITKTVPTSLLAFKLIEEGKMSLDDRLSEYIPFISGKWKDEIKIYHLLIQAVDYGIFLSDYKNNTAKEIINVILSCDLKRRPGTSFSYTNSSSILLGMAIEKVSGKTLSELANLILFEPLKMIDTSFSSDKNKNDLIIPTEIDPWRKKTVRGFVHDESAYVLSQEKDVGSAGLFSTAPDLLNVLEMLIRRGKRDKEVIFSEKTINLMIKEIDLGKNKLVLGWEMNSKYMGERRSSLMLGKTGFTGCFIAWDVKEEIGIVMLSNYHYPKRKKSFGELNKIRQEVIDTIILGNRV